VRLHFSLWNQTALVRLQPLLDSGGRCVKPLGHVERPLGEKK